MWSLFGVSIEAWLQVLPNSATQVLDLGVMITDEDWQQWEPLSCARTDKSFKEFDQLWFWGPTPTMQCRLGSDIDVRFQGFKICFQLDDDDDDPFYIPSRLISILNL